MPKRTEDNINVGSRFKNNDGDWYTIKFIENLKRIGVSFDGFSEVLYTRKWLITKGNVKNHYKPTVHGVGYIGTGQYSAKSNSRQHNVWIKMLERCYNPDIREFNRYGGRGVYVHESWHNFQIFHKWFDENYLEGCQLDKDLKNPSCLVYSPETCIFIPSPVNKLLISNNKFRSKYGVGVTINKDGFYQAKISLFSKEKFLGLFNNPDDAFKAYKCAKEDHIKVVANMYKKVLPEEAYNTLINWEVVRFPK